MQGLVWLRLVLNKGFHFLELPEAMAKTSLSCRKNGKEFLSVHPAVLQLSYPGQADKL